MPTALVTGAGGFLGRSLVPRLEGAGWKIQLVGREGPFPKQGDAVIHLAQGEGPDMRPVAVDLTRRLAAWAQASGTRVFLLASSGSALEPSDDYGKAKREAEGVVLGVGLPRAVVLRFHTLFGPGQAPERLIPRLREAVRTGTPIEVAEPDGVRLSPTHVEEAAEAVLRCLLNPSVSGTFDVAGPEALTVGEIARRLGPAVLKPRARRPGEKDLVGDPDALERILGWKPSTGCRP